jgi:hypothetical protein
MVDPFLTTVSLLPPAACTGSFEAQFGEIRSYHLWKTAPGRMIMALSLADRIG